MYGNSKASLPSAGAIFYGENRFAISSGRGQSQEPDFQGNLVDITDQYQGRQCTCTCS